MGKAKKKAQDAEARPHLEIVQVVIDNPQYSKDHAEGELGNFRKIPAMRNVKESSVAWLFSKKAIDEAQLAAADEFRRNLEAMGASGARAIDYSRVQVDGGRGPVDIHPRALEAGRKLHKAHIAVTSVYGTWGWKLLEYVCGEGHHPASLGSSRRETQTHIDNLKRYLDCLAEHWDLATRRKAS